MDSVWLSVVIFGLLCAIALLAVYVLRTRDATTGHSAPEAKHVFGHTPGAHSIDSEESLRARGQIPKP
jgi:hypothetical protein